MDEELGNAHTTTSAWNHELHCGETDQPMATLLFDLGRAGCSMSFR